MKHAIESTHPIRHPGGKDGWYVSRCTCGREFGPTYRAHHAEQRAKHHVRDLNQQEGQDERDA